VTKGLLEEVSEGEGAPAGGDDNQIHYDHHGVIAPGVRTGFAPEPGVPHEYFLSDGAAHDQNQADGGELREDAGNHAQCAGYFRGA